MLRHVCVHVRVSDHVCETRLAGLMPVPPKEVGSELVVCTLPGGSGARLGPLLPGLCRALKDI